MLTKKKKQILDYLKNYIKENDFAPSLEEIRKHFKLSSVATVHQHIEELKEKGYLNRTENQARSIQINKKIKNSDLVTIPLLGTIAAGQPIEAIEDKETISVQKSLLSKSGEHFALKVRGDSMIEDGISDGDTVIIKKQPTAENGETAVAVLNGNEVTLKKIYKEKNGFRLQPANSSLKPFFVKELEVRGKVISVIRNFEELERLKEKVILPTKKIHQDKLFNSKNIIKKWSNTIQLMDCMEGMKKLPNNSVDLIITDPPYGISRELNCKNQKLGTTAKINFNFGEWDKFNEDWFDVAVNKTKGWIISFCAKKDIGFYWDILEKNNFKAVDAIVWQKPDPIPLNGKSKMLNAWEAAIIGKKAGAHFAGRCQHNIFKYQAPKGKNRIHPTQKPVNLIKDLILLTTKGGDLILDPFSGSGTTAVACIETKRSYIGFEIDKNYYEASLKRINGTPVSLL